MFKKKMSEESRNSVGSHKEYESGAPTVETVERFGQTIEKSQKSPYMIVDPVFVDAGQGINDSQAKARMRAANAGKFPVRPLPSDPYDTIWQIKDDMTKQIRGYNDPAGDINHRPIFGDGRYESSMANFIRPLPFTKKDIEYLQRKRAAEENAAYLFWQASKYNLNDPATRDWFQRVCPSYFDQRASLVEEQIDASARYAKIRLRGPKTEDDYKFQWLIETDRLKLPKGPLWDPYEWMIQEANIDNPQTATASDIKEGILEYNKNSYRRGLFNPIKVLSAQKGGLIPNPMNLGDIKGADETNYVGPIGVTPVVDDTGNYARAYGGPELLGYRTIFNNKNNKNRQNVTLNFRRSKAAPIVSRYNQEYQGGAGVVRFNNAVNPGPYRT